MTDREPRDRFHAGLSRLAEVVPLTICAAVADKFRLRLGCADTGHPCPDALHCCMAELHIGLSEERQHGRTVHGVFKSQSNKGQPGNRTGVSLGRRQRRPLGPRSAGLPPVQFQASIRTESNELRWPAARQYGRKAIPQSCLRPDKPNRAFEIIGPKLRKSGRLP